MTQETESRSEQQEYTLVELTPDMLMLTKRVAALVMSELSHDEPSIIGIHRKMQHISKRPTVAVVDQQDTVVATAGIELNAATRSGFVEDVVTASELRGQGFGRMAMEGVEAIARREGAELILLWPSLVAEDFYLHLGYIDGPDGYQKDL
jgi:GNAT superfamily N-acetyltransferase